MSMYLSSMRQTWELHFNEKLLNSYELSKGLGLSNCRHSSATSSGSKNAANKEVGIKIISFSQDMINRENVWPFIF